MELSVNALEQSPLAERVISSLDASEEMKFKSIRVDENHSLISRLKLPLNTNTNLQNDTGQPRPKIYYSQMPEGFFKPGESIGAYQ